MGAPYQTQAISGYNTSPPPDDGTTVAANKITWNSSIKTKLTDPLNTFAAAINSQLVTWSDFSSVTTSTNLSTTTAHHMQTIEVTSGSPTISLGDAATMTKNYQVTVTNTGTGAPVIALATGANTLDGTAAGTFTFPTGTKTSFTFKVNNGATGYYTEKNGGKTLQAVTSVITPAIDSGTTGSLALRTNNGATQVSIINQGDGTNTIRLIGGVTSAQTFMGIAGDSNTTHEFYLKGNGSWIFSTGASNDAGSSRVSQFQVLHTASATRNVTITGSNGGNPTISTTAGALALGCGQLQFPASQSPSADVNTLDDYEEGTWTPSIGGSATYTTQTGTYTKIGRQVTVFATLTINSLGTGSTTTVSGLPFAPASFSRAGCVGVFTLLAVSPVFLSVNARTTSDLVFPGLTAAGGTTSNLAIFGNSAAISFTASYEV